MTEKEKNYLSAVIYLGDEKGCAEPFLKELTGRLAARFSTYELIFVDDASRDGTLQEVRDFLKEMPQPPPVTVIHMSLRQSLEMALNAGVDMAIGDFVYEFDSMRMPWPAEMIDQVYDSCIEGNDIVAAAPQQNRGFLSSRFYKMFNSASGSPYRVRTEAFRILSRRAINRVRAVSEANPYRKAAYAACGLKVKHLEYAGEAAGLNDTLRLSRAVDTLAMYTNLAFRVALGISVLMLVLMVIAVVYTIVVYFGPFTNPSAGWTTTMLVITGGFAGVFLLLAMVLKYLSLLVDLVFKKQKYLVESVEKIA